MQLFLFILIAYGFSNIVVYGSIFDGFRKFCKRKSPKFFGKLFTCMMCFPTWVGFLLSIIYYSPTLDFGLEDIDLFVFVLKKEYLSVFLDGVLASGTTWLIHTFQEALERHHQE